MPAATTRRLTRAWDAATRGLAQAWAGLGHRRKRAHPSLDTTARGFLPKPRHHHKRARLSLDAAARGLPKPGLAWDTAMRGLARASTLPQEACLGRRRERARPSLDAAARGLPKPGLAWDAAARGLARALMLLQEGLPKP